MWSEAHPRWLLFAGEVVISAEELEREYQMSVEVKGLADIVRQAKDAIRIASDAAAGMRASANELTGTVNQVLDMKRELDAANLELKAAVGAMSNGGPPLDAPDGSTGSSSSDLTADQAATIVAAQNSGS